MVCEDENTHQAASSTPLQGTRKSHFAQTEWDMSQGHETLTECYSHSIVEGGFDEMS